ncbi:MAG TPA: hypothetical protein VKN99_23935 [Polyangia bacterium]|nr:hypothetical protein [Polyangia bacterium]
MRRGGPALFGLLAVFASCAEFDSSFRCVTDNACTRMGRPGTCEPSGFCSFPDPYCTSGRRFDEFAGNGLAGECVGAAVDGAADRAPGRDGDVDAALPDAAPPDAPDPCAMVSCPGGTCMGGTCCQGCWSGGMCMPGTTTAACGSHGVACATCATLQICSGDACAPCTIISQGVCDCGSPFQACCANMICSAGANCVATSAGPLCAPCGGLRHSCCLHGPPCTPSLTCTGGVCGP